MASTASTTTTTATATPRRVTSSVVSIEGDLKVHVPVLGKSVERVIVSGLRKYFEAEVLTIPDLTTS